MNASVSAPGSSGACRASSARNSRPAFSSWADVAPGIAAQVRAQRGRRPDAAEQRAHRAVPQQVHVIDAVRARRHPGDQARDLQVRVDAAFPARADVLRDQVAEPGALRQGHHRDQPGVRHEIRVVERCVRLRQAMQQSHLQGVLSNRVLEASDTPILPGQRAPFTLTRPKTPLFHRWIEAKRPGNQQLPIGVGKQTEIDVREDIEKRRGLDRLAVAQFDEFQPARCH